MARRLNPRKREAREKNRGKTLSQKKKNNKTTEAKQFVTNLSTHRLTDLQYKALAKGMKFIPTPKPETNKKEIIKDFLEMTRKMKCRLLFSNKEKKRPHPFRTNSGFIPPPQNNATEAYSYHTLEEQN